MSGRLLLRASRCRQHSNSFLLSARHPLPIARRSFATTPSLCNDRTLHRDQETDKTAEDARDAPEDSEPSIARDDASVPKAHKPKPRRGRGLRSKFRRLLRTTPPPEGYTRESFLEHALSVAEKSEESSQWRDLPKESLLKLLPEAQSLPRSKKDPGIKKPDQIPIRKIKSGEHEAEAPLKKLPASKVSSTASSIPESPGEAYTPDGTHGTSLKKKLTSAKKKKRSKLISGRVDNISGSQLQLEPIDTGKLSVPHLCHGLDRVLFNPGVYYLQDPRSRVYNFDPYLEKIMPVEEFDWEALNPYLTSSKDSQLSSIAREQGKRFICSTSSSTGVLSQFHFLLSQWRPISWGMLTKGFPATSEKFTVITRTPAAIVLRWQNGTYAIDASKEYDNPTILTKLGHSLEKLLTVPASQFKKYGRSNPDRLSEAERAGGENHHFSKIANFVVRSQLDAHDPRLPGTGIFDLKTRAVISIRMNSRENPSNHTGYQLRYRQGEWESFEREYHDMVRSTMLKYSLQVRMGRMDGIFVAYHNVERIFGFQYISQSEMDEVLHGQADPALGDEEFKISMGLFNEALERATAKFPEQSIRLFFETRESRATPFMYIFAEPVTEEEIKAEEERSAEKNRVYEESLLRASPVSEVPLDEEASMEWQKIRENVESEMQGSNEYTETAGSSESGTSASDVANKGTTTDEPRVQNKRVSEDVEGLETATGNGEASPVPTLDITEEQTSKHESVEDAASLEDQASQEPVAHESEGKTEQPKDILAMVLIARNKVNGEFVSRPENFTSNDEWEVEYSLDEVKDGGWALYKACRERRRKAFDMARTSDFDHFRRIIQKVSNRGREWRANQDKIDEEKGITVFAPLDPSSPEVKVFQKDSPGNETQP